MVGRLGFDTAIKTINRRARGLLLRPMRLGFANLWAFSGPFQTLPIDSLVGILSDSNSEIPPTRLPLHYPVHLAVELRLEVYLHRE